MPEATALPSEPDGFMFLLTTESGKGSNDNNYEHVCSRGAMVLESMGLGG